MVKKPVPQITTNAAFHMPAPTGGLNAFDPASAMPATDCLSLYNLIPYQYGLRSRSGWREWCIGLEGAATGMTEEVDSVVSMASSFASPLGDLQVTNIGAIGVSISGNGGVGVNLVWEAVVGATHYRIRRSQPFVIPPVGSAAPFYVIDTITNNFWDDSNVAAGLTYFYVVEAAADDLVYGPYSPEVFATPLD
jgi:hypothetical protein